MASQEQNHPLRASPATSAGSIGLLKPGVTAPIIGASKMYQLDEAIAATELKLSDDEIRAIEAPYVPHSVPGHV